MDFDIEEIAMELVGNAGESRSLSFEALYLAKDKNFDQAEEKLKEAGKKMLRAHEIQSELIFKEADGQDIKIGLIMVHAQDHLMTAILAKELIQEMVELHKQL